MNYFLIHLNKELPIFTILTAGSIQFDDMRMVHLFQKVELRKQISQLTLGSIFCRKCANTVVVRKALLKSFLCTIWSMRSTVYPGISKSLENSLLPHRKEIFPSPLSYSHSDKNKVNRTAAVLAWKPALRILTLPWYKWW